ncbi:MAG: hypothetical protein J6Y80_00140, partial [Victivallales bacterium]|nr:hypothetical protein [Victivallales bacterium]
EGVLLRDEILPGWGLLVIPPEGAHGFGRVSVEHPAIPQKCPMATRLHLVQNIALSSSASVSAMLRIPRSHSRKF